MDKQAHSIESTPHSSSPRRNLARLKRGVHRLLGGGASAGNDDIDFIAKSGAFDAEYYLRQYPDVQASGMDPLAHYVTSGAKEHRNPGRTFDTRYYVGHYPDVAASGMNPLRHYLEFGAAEGRKPFGPAGGGNAEGPTADYNVVEASGAFDRAYYLRTYPDVVRDGMDPIRHYLLRGAREARNPCALFDTEYYLANNPDVAATDMNPLVHFCRYGSDELRNPCATFDAAWYWITQLAESDAAAHPMAHFMASGAGAANTRAVGELSDEDKGRARAIASRLLEQANLDAVATVRLGMALSRWTAWTDAEKALNLAVGLRWNDPRAHARLANVLSRQAKWWQAAESWAVATRLNDKRADWFFRLGEAQEKMNRFELAAEAYQQAIKREPDHPQWYYRLGYMREKAGQRELADAAYAEAVARDPRDDVKAFGIGVFHQARGYRPEAAEAYARELKAKPMVAELHFRLGMAHDRCYRWQDAEDAYRKAIALTPEIPYWHFRYGFVLERLQRFADAAEAYAAASILSTEHKSYWWYRCGYVLAQAGQYEDACRAYIDTCAQQTLPSLKHDSRNGMQCAISSERLAAYFTCFPSEELITAAVARDPTDPHSRYKLGETLERRGDWGAAAKAYAGAVSRSDEHQPDWYYRLGFVLYQAGRHADACEAFRQSRILQSAHGLSEKKFGEDELGRLTASYVEYSSALELRENVILYECNGGRAMAGNPLAMFRALVADPACAGYLHIWILNDKGRIPDEYQRMENVIFVAKGSDLYLRYLCTAKYLITGHGFPYYFVRRPGQKYLNTWHGTPLKTLGKEQKYKFYDHKWAQRTFLQTTHLISPNPHTTGVLFDSYDIRNLFAGHLAETGYPRVDMALNASPEHRAKLRQRLGLNSRNPIVLYAPTWRGTPGDVSFDVERLRGDLQRLGKRDCQLIFRGHPWMESVIEGEALPCTVVPADIDTNELLSVVDVLITDYSSIFFDFLVTGKPILYYIHDQAEYEQARGLYFSMDEMPGYKCPDIDVLCESLDKALGGSVPDPEGYRASQRAFSLHDDGKATQRAIDFFFNDMLDHVVDPGPRKQATILFHGGSFTPNGITTSFLNLIKHIDRDRNQVVLGFSPNVVEPDAGRMQQFLKLPKDIAVVPRAGGSALSWEERWVHSQYLAAHREPAGEEMQILGNLFGREFRRMYGAARFDVAVSFSGYDSFWGSVLNLNDEPFRKTIYLHNDMFGECCARFPDLIRMFRLYRSADILVSVSRKTNELNRSNLSAAYDIAPEKFISCDNVQDPEGIIALSKKALASPADEALFGQGPAFINIARLSVEKAHAKLIRSFARLVARHPTAKLLILGAGPQQHQLAQLVGELQLEGRVFLLGYRSNPYPFLAKADCFVLSSDHEGQPMTLLEALILGKPIVATDITGNRGVLEGRPGMLVENSEDGLVEGMNAFLGGELDSAGFDWHQYQADAIKQFQERVIGMPDDAPHGEKASNAPTSFSTHA